MWFCVEPCLSVALSLWCSLTAVSTRRIDGVKPIKSTNQIDRSNRPIKMESTLGNGPLAGRNRQISKILWADAFTQPLVKVLDLQNRFKQYFLAPMAKTQVCTIGGGRFRAVSCCFFMSVNSSLHRRVMFFRVHQLSQGGCQVGVMVLCHRQDSVGNVTMSGRVSVSVTLCMC